MFNNVTYNYPVTPSLLTELSMGAGSANPEIYGTQTFVLNHLDVGFQLLVDVGINDVFWIGC